MHPPHQLLLDLAADTASRPSHHCNPPPPGPPPGPPSLLVPPPNRCIPMCAKCSRIRLANWHHLSRALGRRHILMFLGDDGSIHALLACIVLPAIDVYYYYRSSVPIHYICRRLRQTLTTLLVDPARSHHHCHLIHWCTGHVVLRGLLLLLLLML